MGILLKTIILYQLTSKNSRLLLVFMYWSTNILALSWNRQHKSLETEVFLFLCSTMCCMYYSLHIKEFDMNAEE